MANNNCKFYKVVRQVSYDSGVTWVNIGETQKGELYEYDSAECGSVTQYRWVDVPGSYTCVGTTKYQKTKKQYSMDGTTWSDVSPAEYGKGQVLEYMSVDCGYDPTYANEYLTFIPRTAGNFKFLSYRGTTVGSTHSVINTVSYSLDGGSNWTVLPSETYTPVVQAGQKIMWKGNFTPNFRFGSDGTLNSFRSNCEFDVEGNVMSLVYSDSFQGKTSLEGTRGILNDLFMSAKYLKSAENLILPATTLGESCYDGMFAFCTGMTAPPTLPATVMAKSCYTLMFASCESLTTAPSLPATTLAPSCYSGMFDGCSGLTTAPELPATTLANYCYSTMFQSCTSLTSAPDLSATTLAEYCYSQMFRYCTNLNYIKCLATNISAAGCTLDWVYGTSQTGTFVKDANMNNWTRGSSGIKANWTVQNA